MAGSFFIEKITLIVLLYLSLFGGVYSWSNDELEVFDAVDEIKQNFYTLLNVSQDADLAAIKKSFRKLSLALHPDKNPSPSAEQDFRNIVTVYEVLKSPEKRQYYDKFLEHGLPDWKQAMYYYRRVRKMGLQEMCLILTVIISIGQYLVAWASYMEQKYTLKEILKSRDRKAKRMKKTKSDTAYSDEIIESTVKKPSMLNTLPFQICFGMKALTIFVFNLIISTIKNWNKESPTKPSKEQIRQRIESQQKPNYEKPKKVNYVPEVISYEPELQRTTTNKKTDEIITENVPVLSGGLWTDDDLLDLVKLVKKHPAGESERWVKIAEAMNRTVAEVTHMANKIKNNEFRLPTETEEQLPEPEPKKVKTRGGKLLPKATEEEDTQQSSNWTQTQQKAFEAALNKYSKKSVEDRWEKIANCVPGKNKEDCIIRYKKISDMVRQRKPVEEVQETQDQES